MALGDRVLNDYGSKGSEWMSLDWSTYLSVLELDERKVNYVDIKLGEATGPPIVFVHGLGGCWQNWLENIPYFAHSRRVLALDLPGFGASEMPAETITVPGYCKAIDQFCRALDLDSVELVGNSMGGLISADVAIEYPERVHSLALVASAGMHATAMGRLPRVPGRRLARIFGREARRRRNEIATRPRLRRVMLQGVIQYPNQLSTELVYELLAGVGAPGFMDGLRAVLSHDLRAKLHKIKAPTVIVWGRNDRIVPYRSAKRFEQSIPHSMLVAMDETGHVPQLERPQRFNRIYEEFLTPCQETETANVRASNPDAK